MNQFPLRTIQQSYSKQDRQNLSPLKLSSKHNMQNAKSVKFQKQIKESPKFNDNEFLQNKIKTLEQVISKQNKQIQTIKTQYQSNKHYTIALQQKYTILLQSVQPFEEKANIQKLINRITQLENKLSAIQKRQLETNSYQFLKLTQKTTSISNAQCFLQNSKQPVTVSQKCIGPSQEQYNIVPLSKTFTTVQIKDNQSNVKAKKQQKIRKQSTDSDYGVQVQIKQQNMIPIKRHNIQKFITLQSQLKNNQINLSRRRKNSQFQENLSALWDKLINQYLVNDEGLTTKFKSKTEHLLRKGIPYQLRSTVWPMVYENQLGITWQFYMQLLQRRQKGWIQQSVKTQIQKDLNRSFTGKGKQMENKAKLIDQVQQVLQLFHLYRPDVSYVQGMTYPAIVLTTVVGKMRAFCIFANQIVGIPFFKRLYTFDGNYPTIYCKTFDHLLKDVNSNAYEMLQKKHINSDIFLVEWFYTFFSRGMNFETTLKIWDHMAYFGEVAIFKLAVTVIQLVAGYLPDATNQGAMGLIKQFSSYIDQKKLMQAFLNSRVTQQRYKKAYKKAYKNFQS